jgi:capsular polysaccharide biosynthesis protein
MSLLDEIFTRFRKHSKFLLLIVLLPVLTAIVLSLVLPKEYLSISSILPVNSRLSDKARYSSDEIAELYSAFGNGEDLDRLYATARSGSVLMKIVDSFNLTGYYRLQHKKSLAREAAAKELSSSIDIRKTEYGELQIRVWDKEPQMASYICNAIVDRIDKIQKELYLDFYAGSVQKMEEVYSQKLSSARSADPGLEKNDSSLFLTEELAAYRKSITNFRMALQNPPPTLMVLEKAYPSVKPDKPKLLLNIVLTFLVSLFTGIAAVLLFTNDKSRES